MKNQPEAPNNTITAIALALGLAMASMPAVGMQYKTSGSNVIAGGTAHRVLQVQRDYRMRKDRSVAKSQKNCRTVSGRVAGQPCARKSQ